MINTYPANNEESFYPQVINPVLDEEPIPEGTLNSHQVVKISDTNERLQRILFAVRKLLKEAKRSSKQKMLVMALAAEVYRRFQLNDLKKKLLSSGFKEELRNRVSELRDLIERFRGVAESVSKIESIAALLREQALSSEGNVFSIAPGRLEAVADGVSGTYFLLSGNSRALVIKPIDEDCGCINNPKGEITVSKYSPIREDMPLYCSSLKETVAYQFAQALSLDANIAPPTALALIESKKFFYLQEMSELTLDVETPREKLCSVQEFIQDAKPLFEINHKENAIQFDQKQFEELNLFIWALYDTDAHAGNILGVVLRHDENGQPIYGLKKIDNGLTFPERNRYLRNALAYLPNASCPLSDEGKQKLLNADVEALSEIMKEYKLDHAIPAFHKRMALLKELALQPAITLKEINDKLREMESDDHSSSCYTSTNTTSVRRSCEADQ